MCGRIGIFLILLVILNTHFAEDFHEHEEKFDWAMNSVG